MIPWQVMRRMVLTNMAVGWLQFLPFLMLFLLLILQVEFQHWVKSMMMMMKMALAFETNNETVRVEFVVTSVVWVPRVVRWTVPSESGEKDDSKLYQQPWVPLLLMVGQYWFLFDSMRFVPIVVLLDDKKIGLFLILLLF
jgi:hypothetical protein